MPIGPGLSGLRGILGALTWASARLLAPAQAVIGRAFGPAEGRIENSPAIHRWVVGGHGSESRRDGRAKCCAVPPGLDPLAGRIPSDESLGYFQASSRTLNVTMEPSTGAVEQFRQKFLEFLAFWELTLLRLGC